MYKSERMMKAIGDISDDKIEKASRALGYQKERRQTSRIPIRMGRLLSIAAVVALILALGVTAYAVYTHWSRGMELQLFNERSRENMESMEQEKRYAEQSGLSDSSQAVIATANGVTISVEQTVIDKDTAHIALRMQIIETHTYDTSKYDFGAISMKTQKSFYVQNGGTYIRVGDVLLPDLTLDRAESKPIGKYGRIRKQYLKEQLPGIYFAMLLNGELCRHLSSIDEAANERIELIMTQLAHKRGISVKLKGEDQLRWMTYVFGRYHTTNPYYAFTYMPIQNYL